jgi:hypothetical protein
MCFSIRGLDVTNQLIQLDGLDLFIAVALQPQIGFVFLQGCYRRLMRCEQFA